MDENTTLKEFERNAKNCKRQMDKLTKAYYGVTFGEIIEAVSTDKNRTSNPMNTINGGDFNDEQQRR